MEQKLKIITKESQLREAMLNSDVNILNELIDDSLIFIAPNGQVINKQMDLDAHKSKIQKITRLELFNQEIKIQDYIAIVTVSANLEGSFCENDISGKYKYLRIWTKAGEKWKITAGSVTKIID